MPTRFASLSPIAARLVLAGLALLMSLGIAVTAAPAPGPKVGPAGQSDAALYRVIAARSPSLAAYYPAAAAEQRARGYPLRPFVTMREPALAIVTHRLGTGGTLLLYRLLVVAALGGLAWRCRRAERAERIAAAGLAALSATILVQPALAVWHEAWAGLLLAAALSMRTRRRWWPACLIALAALLVRELVLPAVVAMAVAALADRRRAEAAGWAAALALFAAALAFHAAMVATQILPGDPASPGWTRLGGWRFVLDALHGTSLFLLVPVPLVALLVPLALLGWAAAGTGFTDRVALTLAATLVPFMVVGRPDNFYWGLIVAPLLPIGLAFAPRGIIALARQAAAKSPSVRAWAPGNASS